MRRDRSDNSGWGGCLMYYKNGLPIVRETHLEPKRHELMIFTNPDQQWHLATFTCLLSTKEGQGCN